ncbi:DNA primase [Citrobacter braakii]|uniref:DNA primase n=1 Tax=Citrobacter europaeus TaxID=1914243 RepID=UPI00155FD552|nr:DNA primase [Citrobacter braakii]
MIDVTDIIPLDIPTESISDVACQGAHFDDISGIWYTEPRELNEALRGYAYDVDTFNVAAPYYLVITSKMHCWSCHQPTRIHGLMITRFIKQNQDSKGWLSVRRNTFLFHINSLPDEIKKNIKASNYYLDKSKTTGLRYWMNHCEICGERLGDYELFCLEDEAFHQMTVEKILRANVRKVNKLFVSTAGNPADHAPKDVVRYLCDARFVMNAPASP